MSSCPADSVKKQLLDSAFLNLNNYLSISEFYVFFTPTFCNAYNVRDNINQYISIEMINRQKLPIENFPKNVPDGKIIGNDNFKNFRNLAL